MLSISTVGDSDEGATCPKGYKMAKGKEHAENLPRRGGKTLHEHPRLHCVGNGHKLSC